MLEFEGDLALLIHLMSAGRLQLFDKRAGPRDRTSRLLVRLRGGRESGFASSGRGRRLGEAPRHGAPDEDETSRHSARRPGPILLPSMRSSLRRDPCTRASRSAVIAGVGRSWADEVLHAAALALQAGRRSDAAEAATLRAATDEGARSGDRPLQRTVELPIPDKLPMPLAVHRHEGEPVRAAGRSSSASSSRTT